jgi:hypothetical protein
MGARRLRLFWQRPANAVDGQQERGIGRTHSEAHLRVMTAPLLLPQKDNQEQARSRDKQYDFTDV